MDLGAGQGEWITLAKLKGLDWQNQGADIVYLIEREIIPYPSGSGGAGGRPDKRGMRPFLEYRIDSQMFPGVHAVQLQPIFPKGLRALALADSAECEGVGRLRSCLKRATDQLSARTELIYWEAILKFGGQWDRLDGCGAVGDMLLRPFDGHDLTDSGHPFLPIRLLGSTQALSWIQSKSVARRQSRLIAAILTIAWNGKVEVYREPTTEQGHGYSHHYDYKAVDPFRGLISIGDFPDIRRWTVPAWLTNLHVASLELAIQNAALAYHEAVALDEGGHRSFAFAAYCAALESVGVTSNPVEDKCAICGHIEGATARFVAGLRSADLDMEQIRRLKKMYGDYRSRTVHAAELHGGEDGGIGQTFRHNPFIYGDELQFAVGVGLLRNSCRRVLKHLLMRAAEFHAA